MVIGSPSANIINNALDRTNRIERILMVSAIELVVELVDWWCSGDSGGRWMYVFR
jgi:hypothetical protein